MNYDVIASGSDGNAVVLNNMVLVDCGVSFKKLKPFYKGLKLVLCTHEHSDHFNITTITKLASERPTIRFGCGEWLLQSLLDCGVKRGQIDVYTMNKRYEYDGVTVSPFDLVHNVRNCGYKIYFGQQRAIYATDTANLHGVTAKGFDLYMIESNYEDTELQERIRKKEAAGEYAYERQVPSRHLSKAQADEFLYKNMTAKSRYIYMHQHKERK